MRVVGVPKSGSTTDGRTSEVSAPHFRVVGEPSSGARGGAISTRSAGLGVGTPGEREKT